MSFIHGGSYTPSPMPTHFPVPGLKSTSTKKKKGTGGGGARGKSPSASMFKAGGAFSKGRFANVRVPSSVGKSGGPYTTGTSGAGGLTMPKIKAVKPISIGGRRGTGMPKSGISPLASRRSSSPYVKGMHAGSSQSTGAVKKHGLVWGGQVFHTRSAFGRSLASHGASLQTFSKKHGAAYNGLMAKQAKPTMPKKGKI